MGLQGAEPYRVVTNRDKSGRVIMHNGPPPCWMRERTLVGEGLLSDPCHAPSQVPLDPAPAHLRAVLRWGGSLCLGSSFSLC